MFVYRIPIDGPILKASTPSSANFPAQLAVHLCAPRAVRSRWVARSRSLPRRQGSVEVNGPNERSATAMVVTTCYN